jgi:hypothetical protein
MIINIPGLPRGWPKRSPAAPVSGSVAMKLNGSELQPGMGGYHSQTSKAFPGYPVSIVAKKYRFGDGLCKNYWCF